MTPVSTPSGTVTDLSSHLLTDPGASGRGVPMPGSDRKAGIQPAPSSATDLCTEGTSPTAFFLLSAAGSKMVDPR